MKISIITVVYNNERTVETAIKSVLSQTYPDIEYLVVDGNSTDGTKGIIQKFSSKIATYISEKDKSLYDAMNKGVKLATGDVIGILNSDDIYDDDKVIADIAAKFNENANIDMIYGDLVYVKPDNTESIVRKWRSRPYSNNFFELGNVPPHPTLFVKRSVYDDCGYFNLDYKLAADYDFMLRALKKFRKTALYYPRLMVRMRLGGATNKSTQNIIDGNKEILSSWKNNGLRAPLLLMPFRVFKRLIQFI